VDGGFVLCAQNPYDLFVLTHYTPSSASFPRADSLHLTAGAGLT
jgi:hypothetical protein